MALGFGFNKTKVLAAAEKYVQQGKLQNAIVEYEKVVKEDPKDLTVLNTIGDLYARVGNNERAILHFKRVGDAYATEGFTVKAIAMYKKLTKLNPAAVECIFKLAELYTQQGLYNDARSQYVQVADQFLRSGDNEQAAKIFQKMLELDPENAAMQSKLADLYVKMGKKEEARAIFFTAAESLFARGALDAADESLARVLALDPGHPQALLLRAQIAADAGNVAAAVNHLQRISNLDSRPDALHLMLRCQLQLGSTAEAVPLAAKLLAVHNDLSGVTACADTLMTAGDYEGALRLYSEHAERLLAAAAPNVMAALHNSINRIKEHAPALEMLRGIYRKAGETTHLNEVSELLAHAYVQAGELTKARDLYKELAELEPENPLHQQNYKQIIARLGEDATTRPLTPEEGAQAFMVDELEISAPLIEQTYPDEIAEAVKAAITDSELLDSYNLPAKAITPLQAALSRAPHDVMLNQRLASLYARAQRFSEAARCCDTLQEVYSAAGHSQEAAQYAEMAAKYRERIGEAAPVAAAEVVAPGEETIKMEVGSLPPEVGEAPPAAQGPARAAAGLSEFAVETPPAEVAEEAAPAQPVGAHEIDLSSEWESMVSVEPPPPAAPLPPAEPTSQFIGREAAAAASAGTVADLVEEIRFYLAQSMLEEARAGIEKCAVLAPDHPELAGLHEQLAAAAAARAPVPQADVEAAPAAGAQPTVSALVFDESAQGVAKPPVPQEVAPPPPPVKEKKKPVAPPPPPVAAPPAAAAVTAKAADVVSDLALDLEQSLGEDFAIGKPAAARPPATPPPAPVAAVSAAVPAAASPPAPVAPIAEHEASSALSDIFAEFKEGVEETAGEAEDPDTHYNLGVAFKEMGLLDEAIGELQKVCQAIEHGHPFPQVIQAYTWLAQCLVDKGAPQAAIKWYEKALKSPTIDDETRLALHYELANAHEAAGNRKAALDNFMEVYGTNIDYRDVAERIRGLKS